jgi:hypothetical protein
MPPIDTVLVRAGTAAEWADADATDNQAGPILEAGEVGIVTDATGGARLFIGDGTNRPAAIAASGAVRPTKVTAVVLVAGTKVTADTTITATTIIQPVLRALGTVTAVKNITVTRSVGVSFTLTSTDNTDTSTFDVLITQP